MTSASPDIAELIAATAGRDKASFESLYRHTAAKLLGVILRIVKDRSAAEDVLQEVYLRVWQSASSFDPAVGRPMTWLISVARYRAIDVLRQRRDHVTSSDEGADVIESLVDPRDREAEHADIDRLRVCLGHMDPTHRRCLLEAYYEGYSREELAERFAKPVNTIKTWLHRGAANLRVCLEAA